MDDQANNSPLPPAMPAAPSTPSLDAQGAARRRFVRMGAGATGVILTLHSQPGMAAVENAMCVAPSGFMSMTPASRSPQDACAYNRSHGYWKNHPEAWKTSAGIDYNARFGKILPAIGRYEELAQVKLIDVLNPSDAVRAIDQHNVAMQTVTALLNARASRYAGVPTLLPEDRVVDIWTKFASQGYYSPNADATIWGGDKLAEYFESTFR